MLIRTLLLAVGVLFVGGLALAQQEGVAGSGPWSGVIINSDCTADEAFAEAAKCTEKSVPGAKLVLYDDTTRQIYELVLRTQPPVIWETA